MLIRSANPPEVTWVTLDKYFSLVRGRAVTPSIIYFDQECRPYNINYVLCMLWAGIRSKFWTGKDWYDHNDVAALGDDYQTIREATRAAVEKFKDYISVEDVPEHEELLKVYDEFVKFSKGVNPKAKPPIVTPPQPTQDLPIPSSDSGETTHDTTPTSPSPQPQKPASWKLKMASWLGVLTAASFAIKMFLPGVAGTIVDVVLQVLKALVNN